MEIFKICFVIAALSMEKVASCGSTPDPPPAVVTKVYSEKKVTYTFKNDDVCQGGSREALWLSPEQFPGYDKSHCTTLRPGLSALAHGVNKFYFSINEQDFEPPHSKIWELNCTYPTVDDKGYPRPESVESIITAPKSWYVESINSFSSMGDLIEYHDSNGDSLSLFPGSGYLWARDQKVSKTTSITVVTYVLQEYTVKFYGSIIPTVTITKEYKELPEVYEGNESVFYRFMENYGNHFHRDSIMGGRVTVTITHEKSTNTKTLNVDIDDKIRPLGISVNELVNYIETKVGVAATHKYVFAAGGTLKLDERLDSWIASVKERPSRIGGSLIPIPFMFEPEGNFTKRSLAFLQAEESEKLFQEYKKLKILFKIGTSKATNLKPYLYEKIDEQMKCVVPSRPIFHLIKNGIINNYDLTSNYIDFFPLKDTKINPYLVHINIDRVYLIPGLCITGSFEGVKSIEWNIPEGCIFLAYQDPYCQGSKIAMSKPEKFAKLIGRYSSFKLHNEEKSV